MRRCLRGATVNWTITGLVNAGSRFVRGSALFWNARHDPLVDKCFFSATFPFLSCLVLKPSQQRQSWRLERISPSPFFELKR